MQTATATRRDPGFQALSEVPQQFIQTEPDDRRERYFFFAGDFPGCPPVAVEGPDGKTQKVHVGGTTVDTRCIPGRVIWRALVTPCISMPVDVQAHAIPVGRKLNGSEVYDRVNGGIVYAKMLEFSGPAANDLLRDFGNQTDDVDRQRGLVELAPELLTGQPWAKVQKLNITFMYFPNWPLTFRQLTPKCAKRLKQCWHSSSPTRIPNSSLTPTARIHEKPKRFTSSVVRTC